MSSNSGKVAGNNVDVSDYDRTIIAGSSYNANPCTRVNEEYYEKKVYLATAGGLGEMNVAYPRYENVDSSSAFHGGKILLLGFNSVDLQSGAGGINLETTGNINMMAVGGILTLNSTGTVSSTAKQIELNPTNLLAITTPHVYVESKDTTITGNLKIGGNVGVVGGLFVNGPLFCTQLAAPEMMSFTKEDTGTSAKINPNQTFQMTATIPELTAYLATIPDAPKPPPVLFTILCTMVKGILPTLSDVEIQPHIHPVMLPSMNPLDGTSELFEEAKAINSDSPAEISDPTAIIKKQFQKIVEEQTSKVKDWCLNQIGIGI